MGNVLYGTNLTTENDNVISIVRLRYTLSVELWVAVFSEFWDGGDLSVLQPTDSNLGRVGHLNGTAYVCLQ